MRKKRSDKRREKRSQTKDAQAKAKAKEAEAKLKAQDRRSYTRDGYLLISKKDFQQQFNTEALKAAPLYKRAVEKSLDKSDAGLYYRFKSLFDTKKPGNHRDHIFRDHIFVEVETGQVEKLSLDEAADWYGEKMQIHGKVSWSSNSFFPETIVDETRRSTHQKLSPVHIRTSDFLLRFHEDVGVFPCAREGLKAGAMFPYGGLVLPQAALKTHTGYTAGSFIEGAEKSYNGGLAPHHTFYLLKHLISLSTIKSAIRIFSYSARHSGCNR